MFRASSPKQRILSFLGGVAPAYSSAKSSTDSGKNLSQQRPTSPLPAVSQLYLPDSPSHNESILPRLDASSTVSTTSESGPFESFGELKAQHKIGESAVSPSRLHKKASHTLSRRLSSSSARSAGGIFRSKSSSQSGISSCGPGISNYDLPLVSSDLQFETSYSGLGLSASAAITETSIGNQSVSQPSSPGKVGAGGADIFAPAAAHQLSPPGSPTRKARAKIFFGSRTRKTSTTSNASLSGGAGISVASSRPSSPVKDGRSLSPNKGFSSSSAATKRPIDKSMIGLPTEFKHTGGGGTSSPSLATAISLPGLRSPTSGRQHKISTSTSPNCRLTHFSSGGADTDRAAESLRESLAQINVALNGSTSASSPTGDAISSPYPAESLMRSVRTQREDLLSWQPRDSRLDTVKEVPSGFIQRFEKVGQMPAAVPPFSSEVGEAGGVDQRATRADAQSLFAGSMPEHHATNHLSNTSREVAYGMPRPSSPSAKSPSGSSSVAPEASQSRSPRPVSPLGYKSTYTEVDVSNDEPPRTSPASTSVSSRATSPARKARRKPVPRLPETQAEAIFSPGVVSQSQSNNNVVVFAPASTPSRAPTAHTAVSLSQPQAQVIQSTPSKHHDWTSTLAEISDALNSPLSMNSPQLGIGDQGISFNVSGIVEHGQRRAQTLLQGFPSPDRQSEKEKLDIRNTQRPED